MGAENLGVNPNNYENMKTNESVGGPALMIGIGEAKEPQADTEGKTEICIPKDKVSVNDDESGESVTPAPGDIVNPDMKVTRVEGDNVYMVPVDEMQEGGEEEESMESQEDKLREASEEADKQM